MRPISAEASGGESHLTSGNSKGSFTPLLQLNKFPDMPISTPEEARESGPHPDEPRFRLLAPEEVSFPFVFGREFPAFPSNLKRRRSPGERREELQGHATIPRAPRSLSPFQGILFSLHCLDFQTEDRDTPRWHAGQPYGKASWESLMGKPRGIPTDPLIRAKGSVTLLLQLGRKANVHAPTRDEDGLPAENSRSTPKSMSALERNPQVPAPTPRMVLSTGIDGRGIPRGPRATRLGTVLS